MEIVLGGILALFGLVVLALAILVLTPLHVRISGHTGDAPALAAEVRTLWGLSPRLRLDLLDLTDRQSRAPAEKPPKKAGKPKSKKDRSAWPAHPVRAVADFVTTELSRIHIDSLHGHATFGLADPAETGQLYGVLTPFAYGLPSERVALTLVPDFDGPRFDAEGDARFHLTPAALVWPVLRLVLRLKGVIA